MTLRLRCNPLLVIYQLWWIAFVVLALTGFNPLGLGDIVSFLFLSFVPGSLTAFAMGLGHLRATVFISLSVAFSLLELMLLGLQANFLLPLLGVSSPLTTPYLLIDISLLMLALFVAVWLRGPDTRFRLRRYLFFSSGRDLFFTLAAAFFVPLAIAGAFRLNNGDGSTLVLIMLSGITVYLGLLYTRLGRLSGQVVPASLYFIALSLLLMTSLRGWYITGHDIQFEYKVFQLTRDSGLWNMAAYRDAYNACLSITILPTVFSRFLHLPDQYIYKLLFQFFFALTAPLAYAVSRHWFRQRISYLAALFTISFPTYFEDMPFLIRQEIAFLFYTLMVYLIFERRVPLPARRLIFVILGLGVILSHYSTTYTIILIFVLTLLFARPLGWILHRFSIFSRTALSARSLHFPRITFPMVGFLLVFNFIWTGLVTHTGGNAARVLTDTARAMVNGFTENSRSIDAVSLFSFRRLDEKVAIDTYIRQVVTPDRSAAPPGTFVDIGRYDPQFFLIGDFKLPLTGIGTALTRIGLKTAFLVPTVGEILARMMQFFIPVGIIYILFRRNLVPKVSSELYLLVVSYLFFIALNVILPVLSTEYGVFRAIQQSLFTLAPFIAVGVVAVEKIFRRGFAPAFTLSFFVFSTALVPQLFGANSPQLHLNNSGKYYDNYYTTRTEVYATSWLDRQMWSLTAGFSRPQPGLQADAYSRNKISSVTDLGFADPLFPLLIRSDSFVYLGNTNVLKQRASIRYSGDIISYFFPLGFFDNHKDLIYNNGGVRIYR